MARHASHGPISVIVSRAAYRKEAELGEVEKESTSYTTYIVKSYSCSIGYASLLRGDVESDFVRGLYGFVLDPSKENLKLHAEILT